MPDDVVDLGEVWNDVRSRAAVCDDVVDASLFGYVLTHQIRHVVQCFDAVERFFAELKPRG